MVEHYGLPIGYQVRLQPKYFDDILPDAHLWQSDIYRLAAMLARKAGVKRIVDIGCGRGGKLLPLASEFKICGIDYGENIKHLSHIAPAGEWYEADLEYSTPAPNIFKDSVVICADIIEHLVKPDRLIETLRYACETAAYVLVSTPDRERLYGGEHNGPPDNLAHTREWTLAELTNWFRSEFLPIIWTGWTVSYLPQLDKKNTSLIILSQTQTVYDLPLAFEECK